MADCVAQFKNDDLQSRFCSVAASKSLLTIQKLFEMHLTPIWILDLFFLDSLITYVNSKSNFSALQT